MSIIKVCKIMKFYQDEEDAEKYPDCYKLMADFDKRKISTNCRDFCYEMTIDFDEFIKFAKLIESQDKIYNK